jgi:hypothetical protein
VTPRQALMISIADPNTDETVLAFNDEPPIRGDSEAVVKLIAGVLRRAHQRAVDLHEPNEARAILHLAHSFADELATLSPGFDRMRFVMAAINHPSER